MLTVDANVFISAASPADVFHADSDEFLRRIRRFRLPLHCPALLLPETASGIVRPTGDLLAAQMAVISVQTFPGIQFISLTEARSQAAAQIALMCRLRGADAVYVALAQEMGTTLITLGQRDVGAGCAGGSDHDPDRLAGGQPHNLG